MHAAAAPDDQQLLAAFVQQKSDAAFRAIVDRHAPWLYAAAHRQLRDPDLAHDATQIVFILLLKRPAAMRTHQQLIAWLFSTLRYTVKNLLRAERRRHFHELRAALRNPEHAIPSSAADHDLSTQLDAAVGSLAPAYRSALLLRFYQDLPFDQMAALLNISEVAARKRTTRALDLLRKKLGAPGHALSVASLPILLAQHSASPALAHSIATTVLAAKAGAAIPASLAVATKGTALLMAISKLQTAVLIAAACLLIAVPATLILRDARTPAPASPIASTETPDPAASDPTPPANDIPSMGAVHPVASPVDPFTQAYALAPGQLIKRVTDPDPDARQAFIQKRFPGGTAANGALFLSWRDGRLREWHFDEASNYPLALLAGHALNITSDQIEGNLAKHTLHGDFSFTVSPTASLDQRRAALQKLLKDEFDLSVSLEFRDVPRKVIVLSGKWQFARPKRPDADSPHDPAGLPVPCIDIYDTPHFDSASILFSSGIASKRYIAYQLTQWLKQPVVIDLTLTHNFYVVI